MNLREVLRVLRERWAIVISCFVLGLLGAGLVTLFIPREYSTQVTMYVAGSAAPSTVTSVDVSGQPVQVPGPGAGGGGVSAYEVNQLAQARMASYALLLTSERITDPVIQTLNLGIPPDQLASRMTVSYLPDTVVLSVAVSDEQPERAAQIADAVAKEFRSLVQELEAKSGSNQIDVQVVQPAPVPTEAASPRPGFNLALGALIGLLLGLVGAFFRDAVDTSFRSRGRLAQTTGAPTLGAIPSFREIRTQPLIDDQGSRTEMAEAFRQLRTNLLFDPGSIRGAHHHALDAGKPPTVAVLTSSLSGEGTTTTVCNLAIAAADAGRKVLVIDANLRNPAVSDLLVIERGRGLAEVLDGTAALKQTVQTWGKAGMVVDVLPSGEIPDRPSELLSSQSMIDLLNEVRVDYDLVLIDTPALLPVTDAAAVAQLADGVLLIVRYGRTTSSQVETAMDALTAVSGRLLGTVITIVPRTSARIRVKRPKAPNTDSAAAGDKIDRRRKTLSDWVTERPRPKERRNEVGDEPAPQPIPDARPAL